MTAVVDASRAVGPAPAVARPSVLRAFRFELVKLVSQWRIRVLVLACWVAPAVVVAAISRQSSLPADTLFGRWMHLTGWSGSLVVLGFAGNWALPLLMSVVAGDVFAAEDRQGTWRALLVAVRSPARIFAAKTSAILTIVVLLALGLAASGVVGGLLTSGDHSLVGLDGHLLKPADAAGKVLLAWLCVLAPTLTLAALGLIGSIALGRSPIGLLVPALAAIAMQLAQLLPVPVSVRLALPGYGFIAWNALFSSPVHPAPLVIGVGVSLLWAIAATALAYRLFLRRDFTNVAHDRTARRALTGALVPLAALFAATVLVLQLTTDGSGSGIDQDKVQRSVATAFAHIYRLQTKELQRPDVSEAELRTSASCNRGGGMVVPRGAGNDWRCTVSWHLPGAGAATGTAVYQLDVSPNGRYIADGDGPKEVNGYFLVWTATGDAPNPLWQFDGAVDLLSTG